MFKKNNNEGLSEEQRKQKALMELEVKASVDRMQKNLKPFQDEYLELVKKYGIRHAIQYEFDRNKGSVALLVLEECQRDLDRLKKELESKSSIVKPGEAGLVKQRPSA